MYVLLDECVPRPLARELSEHRVVHVSEVGWSGLRNGQLLAAMVDEGFDGLVTVDRNLGFQQSVQGSNVFVVLMIAHSNRLDQLLPLIPDVKRAIEFAQPGQLVRVGN
ncbi:MAG: hypothetical protein KDA22_00190 [Phycisphaerales bacterium]|nr:hypothetical protein [Phycisphaerales bacterium]